MNAAISPKSETVLVAPTEAIDELTRASGLKWEQCDTRGCDKYTLLLLKAGNFRVEARCSDPANPTDISYDYYLTGCPGGTIYIRNSVRRFDWIVDATKPGAR